MSPFVQHNTNSARFNFVISALKDVAKNTLPENSKLILFGSRARGDYRPDSDWDLLVIIPGPERLPWAMIDDFAWPFTEWGIDNEELINVIVHTFSGLEKRSFLPLYKNIKKDGIELCRL